MLCSQSFCAHLILFTSLQALSSLFSQTFLTSFCLRSVQCSSLNLECSSPRSHSLLPAPSSTSWWGLLWVIIVQSPSYVQLFMTPWTAVHQASLSLTISWSLPKVMSISRVMPSSRLIFWHPLLLLPSVFPRIRDFSNESAIQIRWPEYWRLSFSISPSNEYSVFPFQIDWCDLAFQGTFRSLLQLEGINSLVLCLLYGPALTTVHDQWEDHSLDDMNLCQQSNVSAFPHTV